MKRLGKCVKPCEYILVAERAQEWFGSIEDFPSRTRSGKQVLTRLPCIFSGEQFAIVLKHSKALRQYPLPGFRERFVEQKNTFRVAKQSSLNASRSAFTRLAYSVFRLPAYRRARSS